ncbi:MAG: hypothetical protein QG620_563 [Patescibacteria group bacterium]|nr:hypothetical protein [Patescibacteria group bacterium]
MENNLVNFIQSNSPDGGFLQSEEWRKFQESTGRKTYSIVEENFNASIIEHELPLVGKYFYVPRGPVISRSTEHVTCNIGELVNLAKENNVGWIRIEPNGEDILSFVKDNTKHKITKAPHDVQPRELFIIDITKPEEQLLAEMKAKTRYNIRLAGKKGVVLRTTKLTKYENTNSREVEEFLRLIKVTAKRDGITSHPEDYYRKMIETIPENILKLYVAEYENKIIAANLAVFYGSTCTYLHGASDDEHRNVMAPYLLQWQQAKDAKAAGCARYDFGGINTKTGAGITKFKLGFSPETRPVTFPGSYDIIINQRKYWAYRVIQGIREIEVKSRRYLNARCKNQKSK